MFPPGLSMLWETVDPTEALRTRFGFDDVDQAARWLTEALAEVWAVDVRACERIMISSANAIAWAQTDRGTLVVKWSLRQGEFARLGALADLIHRLDLRGLPVAAPLCSVGGARRVVVPSNRQPLSVTVLPAIQGDLLDVSDPVAVYAAGATLARLHHVLSEYEDPRLLSPERQPVLLSDRQQVLDMRQRIDPWLDSDHRGPTAVPAARLRTHLANLPELDTKVQLVHYDYRAANILTAGSEITAVLDFDDVSVDYAVCDLAHAAVVLSTRFTDWRPTSPAARETLLTGYRSVRPLTSTEELWLEPLILWSGIGQVPPGDDPAGWADSLSPSRE